MRKKLFRKGMVIFLICLFVGTSFIPETMCSSFDRNDSVMYTISDCANNETIFEEIEKTKDKLLIFDRKIGEVHVKYWEHVIDGVSVKNDSILLHLDLEEKEIIKYEKSWTDIDLNIKDFLL